jgi:TatD DNase family protein
MIDTHAHLDMSDFDRDRAEVITRASDAGVGAIISVGTDLNSSRKAIEISERYHGIYAAVGIHPHYVTAITRADIETLGEIAGHGKVVAIGETGLDFYRNLSPKATQIQALKWQLDLSAILELPIIIHCRQAEDDMLNLLHSWLSEHPTRHGQCHGVIHCFNGSIHAAREYADMGFYLSLGAYIGYPSSRGMPNVIKGIPRERLLVETDCPFLPPQAYRGKRNEPAFLPFTVTALAEIIKEPIENVATLTAENAARLFRLPPLSNI